ncbi:(2Fe-2S)-binding protein [Paraburkholderia fungorum]|uniref:(2Fe-2S)-binding protein n=1 Tax=Paraburkholderia fungorum TaxID=134537 RepID=UPI00402BE9E1
MHTKFTAPISPLFRSDSTPSSRSVTLRFDDRPITAPAGVSIAAALLLNGAGPFRATPVTSAPRAPYCMMGVCFDCLVEVDGIPNRQACLTPIREGMVVRRQQGASALELLKEGEDLGC